MCTRVVYLGAGGVVVTARSMDWMGPVYPDLWAFPRGMKRNGAAGPRSIEWTSRYGSVVTAAFDIASADGMNERGLVANLLYLDESEYVTPGADDKRRPLAITAWVQYVLDNYASVAEAVEDLRKEPFYVATMMTPDGHPGQLHLSISDAAGDSAIFEYLAGKLVIHHGRQYQVMTNSPSFDQQLALYSNDEVHPFDLLKPMQQVLAPKAAVGYQDDAHLEGFPDDVGGPADFGDLGEAHQRWRGLAFRHGTGT